MIPTSDKQFQRSLRVKRGSYRKGGWVLDSSDKRVMSSGWYTDARMTFEKSTYQDMRKRCTIPWIPGCLSCLLFQQFSTSLHAVGERPSFGASAGLEGRLPFTTTRSTFRSDTPWKGSFPVKNLAEEAVGTQVHESGNGVAPRRPSQKHKRPISWKTAWIHCLLLPEFQARPTVGCSRDVEWRRCLKWG